MRDNKNQIHESKKKTRMKEVLKGRKGATSPGYNGRRTRRVDRVSLVETLGLLSVVETYTYCKRDQ